MKKKWFGIIMAAAIFALAAAPVSAGSLKGAELLEMLSENSSTKVHGIVEKTHAMGYLTGLLEAFVMLNDITPEIKLFCLPPSGISAGDAKIVVVNWLEAHPGRRKEQARILVMYALRDAYPCVDE